MGGGRGGCSSVQFLTFFASLLLLLLLLLLQSSVLCFSNDTLPTLLHRNSREAVEIGIGIGIGGGGSSPAPEFEPINCPPPPPPPPCPPPPRPPSPPRPLPSSPPPPLPSSHPPPPPSSPQPSDFENILLYRAYIVIQKFKNTITCDPKGIIKTWRGYDLCHKYSKNTYQGFFCGIPPSRKTMRNIASIDFNGYNLAAPTIQGFVDKMPDLAIFHANSNNFSGTVPNLNNLPFFYELDVSNNKLMGSFPMNVLPLTKLAFLDLRFNQFFGFVPASVFSIQLDVLFINNNNFDQALPDDLGRTTAEYLTLANNRFTGPIPTSIGQACNTLKEVLFLNNKLSGCLPYQVGLLTKATVFDAGTNQITGPIPLSFGCLMNVEQLNLARNRLCGEVPDVVCLLADFGHLANLSLSSNYFTLLGRSCWKLIERGILDVRLNCIPGLPDQRSPEECAWFFNQPKYCPNVLPYIPCHIPWMSAAAMLPEVDGDRDKAPAARFTGYSSLHNGHGP